MPVSAVQPSDYGFTSGIQVYFWTRRKVFTLFSKPKAMFVREATYGIQASGDTKLSSINALYALSLSLYRRPILRYLSLTEIL